MPLYKGPSTLGAAAVTHRGDCGLDVFTLFFSAFPGISVFNERAAVTHRGLDVFLCSIYSWYFCGGFTGNFPPHHHHHTMTN